MKVFLRSAKWWFPLIPIVVVLVTDPHARQPMEVRWLWMIPALLCTGVFFGVFQPWRAER